MAGLPWVKVATDFADHPKAHALAHRLSDPRAPLHLPPVWGHFARHYADGSMPDTEDAHRALERAALWCGAPGALVVALVEVGLLERKRRRLLVHGWDEWQEGHARKLERDRARMRAKRAEGRENGRATVAESSRDGRAEEETERRGDGEETPSASPRVVAPPSPAAPARPPDLSPVALVLPCSGTGPRQYPVTEAQIAKWALAFPGVDTLAELRKALAWLEANPAKVKTHRGMPAFCVRWLGKAQDDQRGGPRPAQLARRPGMAPMATADGRARDIASGRAPWDPPEPARCPEWEAVLAVHDRLPYDQRWNGMSIIGARFVNGAFELTPRGGYDPSLWVERIEEWAAKAHGRSVQVRVLRSAEAAAAGSRA